MGREKKEERRYPGKGSSVTITITITVTITITIITTTITITIYHIFNIFLEAPPSL